MTYANAYAYVARALGRSTDADRTATAQDAIAAAIEEWNLRRDWRFLVMDTRNGFTVAACTNSAGTLTTSTSNGFAGVNIGQTAVGSTIGTVTVTAIASTTSLTVTGGASAGPETLTFSADIPVIVGTDLYNLPSTMKRIYSVRTLTNELPLTWRDQRYIDRVYPNQTTQNLPAFYNAFNDATFTQSRQGGRIRLFPIPSTADTLRVRYIRPIVQSTADADLLDMPDRYVYAVLELAKYYFLKNFDAETARLGEIKERSEFLYKKAEYDDRSASIDRDLVMIPYREWGLSYMADGSEVIL